MRRPAGQHDGTAWVEEKMKYRACLILSLHIHCGASHYSFELDDEFTAMYKG